MSTKFRVVFFGELNSTFSRLHYHVLRKRTRVELWVESGGQGKSSLAPLRKGFLSARDWWQRLASRASLEWRSLISFGIPFMLHKKIGSPVLSFSSNDGNLVPMLENIRPDLIISAGFSQILPDSVLQTARLGAYNCHPSPLPHYAGRDPGFWILRRGETQSAVTVHRMVAGIDAGNIVAQRSFPIGSLLNHRTFNNLSALEGAVLLRHCLALWGRGSFPETQQDLTQRSLFPRPKDSDYRIDWTQSAQQIRDLVRASDPSPGAWTITRNGKITIREVDHVKGNGATAGTVVSTNRDGVCIACADGLIRLVAVRQETKEVRGHRIADCVGLSVGDELH